MGIYLTMVASDTTIEGAGGDGLHWKERKLGRACISYFKVSDEKKPLFDSIINNIVMAKKLR